MVQVFDSLWCHLYIEAPEWVIPKAKQILTLFEQNYSRFIQDNELDLVNSRLWEFQDISLVLYDLVCLGKDIEVLSGGYFTLTVKSVIESWWYNKNYELQKDADGWMIWTIEIDKINRKIKISSPIEFWAIWKWYALDLLAKEFSNVEDILINAWWDIYCRWASREILLEHPLDWTKAIGSTYLNNGFLAWSGTSKRKWGDKHHLINALTLMPASEMLGVFIKWSNWALTDWLSTMLFCMGFMKAKKFIMNYNLEALIISNEWEIFCSWDWWHLFR